MAFSLKGFRRRPEIPAEVLTGLPLGHGERVLSGAPDLDGTAWLVATNHTLTMLRPDGARAWQRPWHDVDQGSWQRDSSLLTVTWADRSRSSQWRIGEHRNFLQTLRERVQASVVLVEELQLSGRRTGRAVIRQDLASGRLLEQVVLGRGVRADDPEVEAAAADALAYLREQVGLPF